jgi:hypothetical protein
VLPFAEDGLLSYMAAQLEIDESRSRKLLVEHTGQAEKRLCFALKLRRPGVVQRALQQRDPYTVLVTSEGKQSRDASRSRDE